jgi:hypothetical protein
MFDLLTIQRLSGRFDQEIAIQKSKSNGSRCGWVLNFVDDWTKERCAMLKAFEHVALIFDP